MNSQARRAARRLPRLARLLLGQNELRRPADRIEGGVVAALSAAFLTAIVIAAFLAKHSYESQHAAAARLRPAAAVLSQPGPVVSPALGRGAAARARWRLPSGVEESGSLTTLTAPGIYHAPAGSSVRVWLDRAGVPRAAPASQRDMIINALFAVLTTSAGAGLLLILCYGLCRLVLERHRLAGWESAWAVTGPRWTARQ